MQQMQSAINGDDASPEVCAATVLEVVPALMRVIRAQMRRQRTLGLTVAQFRALGYVGRHAGASLSALAEHLGLTPPATSRLVDGLVARQMVRRELSPADRRAVKLTLMPAGATLLEEARRHTLAELETIVARLSDTERSAIIDALRDLNGAFFGDSAPVPAATTSTFPEEPA
jgi:DNA-binding MarR family transcriptional regulator